MKYLLIIVAILVIYGLVTYGRLRYYVRFSPNPEIVQSDFVRGTGPSLRYIAAGDSTAVGEGASTVEGTYTVKIANELQKTNSVTYKNIAVSGSKTKHVINNQLQEIIKFNPDLITISIGANDLTHRISSEEILNNYQTIITELTTQTKAKIYITNIPNFTGADLLPWLYIKYLERTSEPINKQLQSLESDRVKIINIHDFGWDSFADKSVTYSLDHFHPSDIGYQNWANAFLSKIIANY